MANKDGSKRRITLDLAESMLSGVDELAGYARESRNTFIATAIAAHIREQQRARTDSAFARMGNDGAYQDGLQAEERLWAGASDAAWSLIDSDPPMQPPPAPTSNSRPSKVRRAAR